MRMILQDFPPSHSWLEVNLSLYLIGVSIPCFLHSDSTAHPGSYTTQFEKAPAGFEISQTDRSSIH